MSSKKQKIDLNESSSGMLNGDNFNENGCQNEANLDNYHESGKLICRDFQRKNCFRGMSCRFLHVEESQESSLNHNNCNNNNNNSNNNHHGNSNPNNNNNNNNNGSNNNSNNHHNNSNSNNGKNLPLATMFCRDFQASKCTRNSCKFIHCTRQDEMRYRKTGRLPTDSQFEGSILGVMPVCKDYLNNACFRSNCKFRHSSSSNSSDRSQNSSDMNSHHAMPELNGGYSQHPQQQQQQQQPFLLPQSHQRPHSMHPMMFHPNGHYPMEPNLYPPLSPHDHHQSNGVDGGRKRKLRQFEGNIDYNGYNHYDLQLLWETQEENRQLRKSLEDCQNRVAEITKNLDFVMEQFTRVQSGQATVITPAAAVAVAAQVATSVSASLHSAPASVGTISTTTFPTALSLSTPIGVQPPPPIMAPTVLAALPPPPPPSIVSSISAIPLPTVSSIATIPLPTVSQAMNLGNSSATLVNYTTTTVWPHNVEQ